MDRIHLSASSRFISGVASISAPSAGIGECVQSAITISLQSALIFLGRAFNGCMLRIWNCVKLPCSERMFGLARDFYHSSTMTATITGHGSMRHAPKFRASGFCGGFFRSIAAQRLFSHMISGEAASSGPAPPADIMILALTTFSFVVFFVSKI